MDFESQIEKIAKDIRDREDKELALALQIQKIKMKVRKNNYEKT